MTSLHTLVTRLSSLGLEPVGDGPVDDERPTVEGGPESAFRDIVAVLRPTCVVEVGSWEGRSAVLWGRLMSEYTADWLLVCVDTWLGSLEMWERDTGDWSRAGLHLKDGYPTLFATFASNVRRAGLESRTVALPPDSAQAASLLRRHKVTADIVYVDAAHDFTNVSRDIRHAHGLLNPANPRSLVLCDDYMSAWPGVQEAIHVVANEIGATILVKDFQAALIPATAPETVSAELDALGWREISLEIEPKSADLVEDRIAWLTTELRDRTRTIGKLREKLDCVQPELLKARAEIRTLRQRRRALRARVGVLGAELRKTQERLTRVLSSRSWAITAPLRRLRRHR